MNIRFPHNVPPPWCISSLFPTFVARSRVSKSASGALCRTGLSATIPFHEHSPCMPTLERRISLLVVSHIFPSLVAVSTTAHPTSPSAGTSVARLAVDGRIVASCRGASAGLVETTRYAIQLNGVRFLVSQLHVACSNCTDSAGCFDKPPLLFARHYFHSRRGVLEEFQSERYTEMQVVEARLKKDICEQATEFEVSKTTLKVIFSCLQFSR